MERFAGVGAGVRAVVAPVVNGVRRMDRWWDTHEVVTALVLPALVPWGLMVYGFRWWTVPFALLAAVSLMTWGAAVAKLLRKARRS
ncbi:hypothetical protein [Streptomyces sp. G45]|uniref:hypothetical protein n=1 Tax=Streptomyces sp. G45 TaxID=3406627 RepID=UPI003C251320